jgi:branched-chain amino acid transport system permease protein
MSQLIGVLIAGLAIGAPIFLVASGLVLVFSVMGVLNFAHAGFYLVGAFVFVSVAPHLGLNSSTWWGWLIGVAIAGVIVAGVSVLAERFVFARTYGSHDHLLGLLVSFALLILVQGICELLWGTSALTTATPTVFYGVLTAGGVEVSKYIVVLIAVALLAAGSLWYLIFRTRFGMNIRAVASDRTMAAALGVNVRAVSIAVFAIGGLFAGVAGAIDAPTVAVDVSLLNTFTINMFAAVVLGGFGSVWGALAASAVLGILDSLLAAYVPSLSGYAIYVAFAAGVIARMYLPAFKEVAFGGGGVT